MAKQEEFIVDMGRVSRDIATELMIHHLHMAHAYFQISPEGDETRDEMLRQLLPHSYDGGALMVASRAWFDVMTAEYERMKKND